MYILLSWNLVVTAPDWTALTTLSPITSVGELGIITNQQLVEPQREAEFLRSSKPAPQ